MVREVFESGVANFGAPEEVLTDNGSQYHTWRGKSAFRKLLDRRGIRQIVARPRHPQTLGKIERFWGTLWRELLDQAIFRGIDDARVRIGHFVSYYNFQRPHQGIGGSVPADRFFDAESQVRRVMEARIRANALELARHGEPRKPVYLTGRVGNEQFGIHTEGGKLVYTRGDGTREEVDVEATGRREAPQDDVGVEPEHDHAEPDDEEDDEPTVEDGPPVADGAPPDHAATADDSVEQPPGGSVLDDVLQGLVQRWQEDAPGDGQSTEKDGAR
jgi:hypothetical protein